MVVRISSNAKIPRPIPAAIRPRGPDDHEAARLRREHDPDPVRTAVPEEEGGRRRVPQQENQEAAADSESEGEPGLDAEDRGRDTHGQARQRCQAPREPVLPVDDVHRVRAREPQDEPVDRCGRGEPPSHSACPTMAPCDPDHQYSRPGRERSSVVEEADGDRDRDPDASTGCELTRDGQADHGAGDRRRTPSTETGTEWIFRSLGEGRSTRPVARPTRTASGIRSRLTRQAMAADIRPRRRSWGNRRAA